MMKQDGTPSPRRRCKKKFFLNNGGLLPYHTGNLSSYQGGNSRLLVILKVRKMILVKTHRLGNTYTTTMMERTRREKKRNG